MEVIETIQATEGKNRVNENGLLDWSGPAACQDAILRAMTAKIPILAAAAACVGFLPGADFPSAEVANGRIRAKIYLPDAQNGYYRGTRFDWSGVVYSLQYKGHNYYGP